MTGERGEMNLIGLLVAASLFIGVLGATLSMFGTSERVNRLSQQQAEAQAQVRGSVDLVAKELRNVASPIDPSAIIDRALPHDLIFRKVDPRSTGATANLTGTMRVRLCVEASSRKLLRMEQTTTLATLPAVPTATDCPGSGWTAVRAVATDVANLDPVPALSTFAYDAGTTGAITAIRVTVAADADKLKAPGPTQVSTGVFLRNQNRAPTAVFASTALAGGGVSLNASSSADPDGSAVSFAWKDETNTVFCTSLTCTYKPVVAGAHTITLTVTDAGGATGTTTKGVTT